MFLRLLAFMFVSNTKIKKALGNLAEPASGSFVALYIGGVKRTGASFFSGFALISFALLPMTGS